MDSDNPYKPTNASLKDAPPPPRSPILAVIAGLAVDLLGTLVASIVIAIVYAVMLAAQGMPAEQIQATLTANDTDSNYFFVSAVVGISFSLLGGYVCARIVRRNELRVTAILAMLVLAPGFFMGRAGIGLPLLAVLQLATFAAVLSGGALGRRHNLAGARGAGDVSAG